MATNKGTRVTTASPEAVWKIWSDPTTWGSWNPDVEEAGADGPLRSGTAGWMKTHSGGRHDIVFEDVVEGRGFTVVARPMPATRFHFRCEIEPSGSGSTISQSLTLHGLMAFMSGMIVPGVVKTFGALLDGLAEKAEAAG